MALKEMPDEVRERAKIKMFTLIEDSLPDESIKALCELVPTVSQSRKLCDRILEANDVYGAGGCRLCES